MAFVEESLAQANDALKDYIIPGFQKMFYTETALLDRLKRTSKDVYGRNILFKYKLYGNSKAGYAAERGALPTAGARGWDEGSQTLRYFYAPVDLTGQEIDVPHGTQGAVVDLLADAFEDAAQNALHKADVDLFGNGDGILALCNGNGSYDGGTGLTTVTFDTGLAANFLERQSVSFGTDTTEYEITAIDEDNSYIYIDGDCSAVALNNIAIYNFNSYSATSARVIWGLNIHTSATNPTGTTYQGIDRSTTAGAFTHGYVNANSGVDRVLTPLLLTQHFQKLKRRSGGFFTDLIATEDGVLNSFVLLLDSMKQPIDPFPTETGTKERYKFVFMGKPIALEVYDHCKPGVMYTVATKFLEIRQARPFTWDAGGAGKLEKDKDTDTVWGRMKWYWNMICINNKPQGVMQDIKRNAIA